MTHCLMNVVRNLYTNQFSNNKNSLEWNVKVILNQEGAFYVVEVVLKVGFCF